MAKLGRPDAELVYLRCSSIFKGANAAVRQPKIIVKLLRHHQKLLSGLFPRYTFESIAVVAKELLEARIFESLPRAKARFPHHVGFAQVPKSEPADDHVSPSQAETPVVQNGNTTANTELDQGRRCQDEVDQQSQAEAGQQVETNVSLACPPPATFDSRSYLIPTSRPMYLSSKVQHNLLVAIQTILEHCCFDFGKAWLPDLMEAWNWDEVETVELNKWTVTVLESIASVPQSALALADDADVKDVFLATSAIRHAAVHREATSAETLVKMLRAAIRFAATLNDHPRVDGLKEMETQVQTSIQKIVDNQRQLERKLSDELDEIRRRRAELDEVERKAYSDLLLMDKKHRLEISTSVENTFLSPVKAFQSCSCVPCPSTHQVSTLAEAADSPVDIAYGKVSVALEIGKGPLTGSGNQDNEPEGIPIPDERLEEDGGCIADDPYLVVDPWLASGRAYENALHDDLIESDSMSLPVPDKRIGTTMPSDSDDPPGIADSDLIAEIAEESWQHVSVRAMSDISEGDAVISPHDPSGAKIIMFDDAASEAAASEAESVKLCRLALSKIAPRSRPELQGIAGPSRIHLPTAANVKKGKAVARKPAFLVAFSDLDMARMYGHCHAADCPSKENRVDQGGSSRC